MQIKTFIISLRLIMFYYIKIAYLNSSNLYIFFIFYAINVVLINALSIWYVSLLHCDLIFYDTL